MAFLRWLDCHFNLLKNVTTLRVMPDSPKWIPCQSVSENATLEDLKLVFSEARSRLDEIIEDSQRHLNRSTALVTGCITLLTLLIAFIFTEAPSLGNPQTRIGYLKIVLVINATLIAAFLCFISVRLKANIVPAEYSGPGTRPKNLFVERFISKRKKSQKNANEFELYKALIEDYQARIEFGGAENIERSKRVTDAVKYLYYIPVITFGLWLLSYAVKLIFFR